jgi:adenylate kinase family enzyme
MEEAAAIHGRSTLYLVDGFPRNYDNLEGWNRFMSMPMENNNSNDNDDQYQHQRRTSVWGVLLFTCPLPILEQRILSRAQTSGRSDDNIISAQKRFHTFQEQTMPVVEMLRQVQQIQEQSEYNYGMPLQVHDIRGDLSIEQVWDTVQDTVQQFMANDVWTANAKLIEAVETQNETLYRQLCPYMTTTTSSPSHPNGDNTSMMAAMEGTYRDDSSDANDSPSRHHVQISNASIRCETGTKAITSYDRVFRIVVNDDNKDDTIAHTEETVVREERVWSHEGTQGWVNVHFTRTPKEEL